MGLIWLILRDLIGPGEFACAATTKHRRTVVLVQVDRPLEPIGLGLSTLEVMRCARDSLAVSPNSRSR